MQASLLACAASRRPQSDSCGDRGKPPRPATLHRGERSHRRTFGEREMRTRPSSTPGRRSRRRRKSGWMSRSIDDSTMRSAPVWKTPVDAQVPKDFLAVSLARYLELLDWTGRPLQQDKWARSRALGTDPRAGRARSPGWCDVVRKFRRVFSEPQARRSLASGGDPLADRAGCCARENPLGLSSD